MTQGKNLVGVKILLEHGHFMAWAMREPQARQLVTLWSSGQLAIKGHTTIDHNQFPAETGEPWAVRLDQIIGIHFFDLQAMVQAQQQGQAPPQKGPWYQSGGYN